MSQTPSWEEFQPFIRDVVIAALYEKRGHLVSDFAMSNAQVGSMVAGMMASLPEGVSDSIGDMVTGQNAGNRGAQAAILAAFDAAIAKLEG